MQRARHTTLMVSVAVFIIGILFECQGAGGVTSRIIGIDKPGFFEIRGVNSNVVNYVEIKNIDQMPTEREREETFRLQMLSATKQELGSMVFESSYGRFRVEVVDWPSIEHPLLILFLGQGRGTGTRSEEMWIVRSQGKALFVELKTPYSGSVGGGTGGVAWKYTYEYARSSDNKNLQIIMRVSLPAVTQQGSPDQDYLPHQIVKKIELTPDSSSFVDAGSPSRR